MSKSDTVLQMTHERIIWPDMIRITSVFAMIMLHVAAKGYDNVFLPNTLSFQTCNFYNGLVRFCVPEFIMLSGVFFLDPHKDIGIKKLYCSKILRIIIAYLFWSIFYSLLDCIPNITIGSVLKGMFINIHYHLWFCYLICGLYIVTPLLRQVATDEQMIIYFIILAMLFVYIPNLGFVFRPLKKSLGIVLSRFSLTLVGSYASYFLLGYWLSFRNLSKQIRIIIYSFAILSIVFTVLFNGLLCVHRNRLEGFLYDNLMPNILLIATAVFVFIKQNFGQASFSPKINTVINKVAKLSFGIYLIHAFILDNLPVWGVPYFFIHPVFSVPIIVCLVFIVSFLLVCLLDKIPYINRYII